MLKPGNKFLLALICFLTVTRSFSQVPVSPEFAQRLQHKIDSCVEHYALPGISVSLLLPGNKYWNGASGLSDIYTSAPMDTALLFQQASVTKMFVAATVFQMVEQGLLSLEDTVGTYLSPILYIPGSTKIKYLLNHRSGMFDFIAGNPAASSTWFSYPDSIWTGRKAIETYGDDPDFPQGAFFSYSNTNYILLGMIVEQITGHSFAVELHNRFLGPYGFEKTFMPPVDSITAAETPGWTSFVSVGVYDTDASVIMNDCFASMGSTAGALVAVPSDVARFTRLLYTGAFVDNTSLATMKTCTAGTFSGNCTGFGYGSMRYQFSGKTFFGHSGDISGFTQFTAHQEEDSITLTISINRNSAPRGPIAQDILDVVYAELLGVEKHAANEAHLVVFPNPAERYLNIAFGPSLQEKGLVTICDASGKVLLQHEKPAQEHSCIIEVNKLDNGIYFARLTGKNGTAVKKFVINR